MWPEGVSKVSLLPFESVLTGKGRIMERNPLLQSQEPRHFHFLVKTEHVCRGPVKKCSVRMET